MLFHIAPSKHGIFHPAFDIASFRINYETCFAYASIYRCFGGGVSIAVMLFDRINTSLSCGKGNPVLARVFRMKALVYRCVCGRQVLRT